MVNNRKFLAGTVFFFHINQPIIFFHEPATKQISQPTMLTDIFSCSPGRPTQTRVNMQQHVANGRQCRWLLLCEQGGRRAAPCSTTTRTAAGHPLLQTQVSNVHPKWRRAMGKQSRESKGHAARAQGMASTDNVATVHSQSASIGACRMWMGTVGSPEADRMLYCNFCITATRFTIIH